jgi:DNA-binding phage protein
MHNKKTSTKQDVCFDDLPIVTVKNKKGIKEVHPEKEFKDHKKVALALFECLIDNDVEGFMEILDAYLRVNRRRVAKGAKLARSTVQLAFSGKGNPTIKTLAKIVHDAVAA